VLPVFVLGLAVSQVFQQHREAQRRFRVVAFAFLTPFFFLKGGMNVSLGLVWANLGLLSQLFMVKLITKTAGVYPLAIRYLAPRDATFTTLLMSTGLTFGTISSLYGLRTGLFDQARFSVVVTVVVLSAVVPTFIAQRWFEPRRKLEPVPAAPARAPVADPAKERG
jgi:Kef-type K+ transport system membrane component KefB